MKRPVLCGDEGSDVNLFTVLHFNRRESFCTV